MTVIAASIRRGAKIATALVLIATLHILVLVARAGAHTGRHHAFTYNLWGGSAHHNGALAPAIRVVAHEQFMRDGGHDPLAFALQEACDSVNYFSQTDYLQSAFSGRFTVHHGPTICGSNPGSSCQYSVDCA